jgi:hypothetical protein
VQARDRLVEGRVAGRLDHSGEVQAVWCHDLGGDARVLVPPDPLDGGQVGAPHAEQTKLSCDDRCLGKEESGACRSGPSSFVA